jgi:tetratricopeptide (TPR) repeat protein
VRAYGLAYQLDPDAFDATQLNAYAGVLDEVGDYDKCELIAKRLIAMAGDDLMLLTSGWNHLACASIGLEQYADAIELAHRAIAQNPLPDNAAAFAATLERAKTQAKTLALDNPQTKARDLESYGTTDLDDASWRVRFAALGAMRFRFGSEDRVEVTARARAAATKILAETTGLVDINAVNARVLALQIREQAYFARDPVPALGDRMTRDAFYTEFRARGGVVLGEASLPTLEFVDRVVVPGGTVSRASDYIELLRELSERTPPEALAQFDLDEAGYLDLARAWAAAMEADPTIAGTIAAGLAARR